MAISVAISGGAARILAALSAFLFIAAFALLIVPAITAPRLNLSGLSFFSILVERSYLPQPYARVDFGIYGWCRTARSL
jgi:hypothetical protein